MKRTSWGFVVSAVVLLVMTTGCGKKEHATASAGSGQAAGPKVADVQAWTLANAFLKDLGKAKAEYDGKECIVRDLLAYMAVSDTRVVSSCAFDPKTKTVSTKIACRYQGQDLVNGEEFSLEVEFADAAEFESIKDASSATVAEKPVSTFETLFAVRGTLKHEGTDNGLAVKKARLVK